MGAVAVGATIYFGSPESRGKSGRSVRPFRQRISWEWQQSSGATCEQLLQDQGERLPCGSRLDGSGESLGVTIEADIIKQKLPENNGGFTAINFGKTHKKVYSDLTSEHPIDLTRYQVLSCYSGRAGLINSGGASSGESDLAEAVRTAVINKRAGGMGLISGRKAFQRPLSKGSSY